MLQGKFCKIADVAGASLFFKCKLEKSDQIILKGAKMRTKPILIAFLMLAVLVSIPYFAVGRQNKEAKPDSRLAVLWTSGDPEVAHKVCFMYTHNAKKQKWFDEVVLIIWGPSSRLLAADKDLQAEVKKMQQDGVVVQACQACADLYGVSDIHRKLGIEVKYMGKPLTNMLKSDYKILNF